MFNVIVFSSLRAGGDSRFLAFLDAGILWMVGLPMAFVLVGVFNIRNIALVFLFVQVEQLVRVIIGMKRYIQGTWLKNLTQEIAVEV
jgi:Na+-driven multidrug efflux pump